MSVVPRRETLLRGMAAADERLRSSMISLAARAPTEQEPERVVGAPGQPGFENGWTIAPGEGPPRFWRTSSGWVHLAGAALSPSGSGAFITSIFTLPTRYRPPFEQNTHRFVVPLQVGGLDPRNTRQRGIVQIFAENRLNAGKLLPGGGLLTVDPVVVALDGISFRTT
jgi:hypothetical protein